MLGSNHGVFVVSLLGIISFPLVALSLLNNFGTRDLIIATVTYTTLSSVLLCVGYMEKCSTIVYEHFFELQSRVIDPLSFVFALLIIFNVCGALLTSVMIFNTLIISSNISGDAFLSNYIFLLTQMSFVVGVIVFSKMATGPDIPNTINMTKMVVGIITPLSYLSGIV